MKRMKSIIAVLVAVVFLLSLASLSFAKGDEKMALKGEVTKIDGNKVTVKDSAGKETTVEAKEVKDIKVGDKVKIKEGVIKKITEEKKKSESEKSEKPKY
jgi:hypothetical protein